MVCQGIGRRVHTPRLRRVRGQRHATGWSNRFYREAGEEVGEPATGNGSGLCLVLHGEVRSLNLL